MDEQGVSCVLSKLRSEPLASLGPLCFCRVWLSLELKASDDIISILQIPNARLLTAFKCSFLVINPKSKWKMNPFLEASVGR